jgi:glycosyltransferase involved in cell wall biosynthesis
MSSKNKDIKLSIITVCYNNREGLLRTMESVKRQTFKNYEYIIIDGGSTDGTVELIKEHAKSPLPSRLSGTSCGEGQNLSRLSGRERYIDYWTSEPDNGIYNAMNKGIRVAKGAYCYFLNSDDCIAAPDTLEKIFREAKEDADIIYGNLAIRKGSIVSRVAKSAKHIRIESFFQKTLAIHHQASFIRTNLFYEYGFYREDIKIISDWIFFFDRIILDKISIQYIDIVFSIFLTGGRSSTLNEENIMRSHLEDKGFSYTFLLRNILRSKKNYWQKFLNHCYYIQSMCRKEIFKINERN